jgi:transglutaminase-like putative cysteine protease
VKGSGDKLKIIDPRATTEIWLNAKGEMLFATGPLGMQMRPITREEAVGSEGYLPEVDIASASRIVPDKPIENPSTIKSLTLKLTGANLPRLRNDYYQKIYRGEDGTTTITIAPLTNMGTTVMISTASSQQPEFVKSALNVPAEDAEMKKLARNVLAGETDAYKASQKLSAYVFKIMRPNASIGVLRDAREILRTKEGVCRDYATLAATLMRAAGIPTKLVTGAVYSGDGFYYHAWVENWVGDRWIAFDPTLGGGLADATHIKFAEGNPEEAFITFTLDGAKIEVKEIVR